MLQFRGGVLRIAATTMQSTNRIEINPAICSGKPVIRGTRILNWAGRTSSPPSSTLRSSCETQAASGSAPRKRRGPARRGGRRYLGGTVRFRLQIHSLARPPQRSYTVYTIMPLGDGSLRVGPEQEPREHREARRRL